MIQAARCLLWTVALVFAGAPVFLPILTSTASFDLLMDLRSYDDKKKDLMFFVVSILAIGILDAFDCIITAAHPKSQSVNKAGLIVASAIGLMMILQLFFYATWLNSVGFYSASDTRGILYLVLIATICALTARAALVFGGSE